MVLFLGFPVTTPAESSGVIMVVAEVSHIVKSIGVNIFGPFGVIVPEVVHIFLVEESVSDPEEEGIVEYGIKGLKVSSKVPHISIEDFPNSIDS